MSTDPKGGVMPAFLFVTGALLVAIARLVTPRPEAPPAQLSLPAPQVVTIEETYRSSEEAHELILEQLGIVDLPRVPELEFVDLTHDAVKLTILQIEPAPDPVFTSSPTKGGDHEPAPSDPRLRQRLLSGLRGRPWS